MAPRGLLPMVLVSCMLFSFGSSVSATPPQKVNVSLYYQTLSYECSDFMAIYLPKIFDNGLIDIVNLRLVPYGNAKIEDGKVICQNGPKECLLNTVHACAIYTRPNLNQHYPFLKCIADVVVNPKWEWKKCYSKMKFPSKPIDDCINSGLGDKLLREYGNETPLHKFLPWLVVNNQPLKTQFLDFMAFICKAYEGPPPKPCQVLSPPTPMVLKADKARGNRFYPAQRPPNAH